MLPAWKTDSSASGSDTLSLPVAVRELATSSVTEPLTSPVITAPSFTPAMVMVTVCVVPSADSTVNVSVSVFPSPRDWIADWPLAAK